MSFDTSEDRTHASGPETTIVELMPLSPAEIQRRSLLSCEIHGYGLKDFNGNRLLSKGCKISVETGKVLIATKLITDCDLLDAVLGQEGHITDWKERRQKAVENVAQCITYWAFGSKTKLSEDTGSQLVKEITSTIDARLEPRTRAFKQAKQCTFDEVLLAFQEHTERGLGEPCLIEQQVSDGEGNTDKQYDSHVSFKTVWELLLRGQVEHLEHLDRPDASKLVNTLVGPILQAAKTFTTDCGGSKRAKDEITKYWCADASHESTIGERVLGTSAADP